MVVTSGGQFGIGIIYALLAGALWGVAPLLLKRGMILSNVSAATLVQQFANVLTLVAVAAVEGGTFGVDLPAGALWSFVGAGVAGGSLGRIFYNKGIDKVGASKSISIKNSDPIVTVLSLVLFLGEKLTLPVAMGVGLIVAGIVVLTRINNQAEQRLNRPAYFFYPLVSLFFYGVTPVFKKMGMLVAVLPTAGALVTQVSALIVILTVGRFFEIRPRWEKIEPKSLLFFFLSGTIDSLGSLFTFHSLKYAPAVMVAPIWRISPLVAFAFTHVTLGGIEVVTPKDGLAAILIVSGVLVLYQG